MRRLVGLIALAGSSASFAQGGFPEPADAEPRHGRDVWLGTCRECHANPLSDAPQVKNKAAWEPRIAQGRAVLYTSALKGKTGKGDTEMPPRGGNASLSDDDVRGAVDYMLFLVDQFSRKEAQ
jgi:cytochrome c5